jgi:uncharacterized protein (DUF433 family)
MAVAEPSENAWRRRLFLPNYQVQEAAKYAQIAPQTVVQWQKGAAGPALAPRERRTALSYMQLIEVAVVAALRKEGVPLKRVRDAREYLERTLKSEFPFAEYRFKSDGKGRGKLLRPDQEGQLAWEAVIGRLKEFEYERNGIVIRWRVAGPKSAVAIDPRISFGAPMVKGIPTWAIKGRWDAGEDPTDIAADFSLRKAEVIDALLFEGIDGKRLRKWLH